MAILDVNRLGAVTRTTPTGFLSNLVQRERLGWPTCMPIYFLFGLKNDDMAGLIAHIMMYDIIEVKHILEGCNAHRYDQIYY